MESNIFGFLAAILLCLLISLSAVRSNASSLNFQARKQLKSFNKSAVKSIKSIDGDIIDCVNIYDQPALDHPSLKDHKTQRKPSSFPQTLLEKSEIMETEMKNPAVQVWHQNGRCPEDTIPIRRTEKKDVFRSNSFKALGKKQILNPSSPGINGKTHEHAVAYMNDSSYFGTRVLMNVWNPSLEDDKEFTLSQVWLLGGSFTGNDLETIEAGWQVFPALYGDNKTRFFTYWTNAAYETGCYNLQCSGFLHVSPNVMLGAPISPVSSYDSDQYNIDLLIWKDINTNHWWLSLNNEMVGYWPSELFRTLSQAASVIEWGGEILNKRTYGHHTSTQMGSGHSAKEGFSKAAWMRDIRIVNYKNEIARPSALSGVMSEVPQCYDIWKYYDEEEGHSFYYGGPRNDRKCVTA